MMARLSLRAALLIGVCGLSIASVSASPTGDTVYISTINLPTDFGRPVTYDGLGVPNGWDINTGSGVPLTIGTPLTTNGVQINIHSTQSAGIPGGVTIINSDGNPIQATFFEDAGELLESSFIVQPPDHSFSNDPFGAWGFLIEDINWRQKNGTPLNLPVTLYDGSTFLELTTTGGGFIDPSFLGSAGLGLISTGPHPLHPERTVIYFSDSESDLDDVTVYPTGSIATDSALIEPDYPVGILEALTGVTITGFNIGQYYIATVPGDANGDRMVTGADYTIWADHFGQTVDPLTNGDFNNDGSVTGADYTIWADNFGFVPSVNAVPEPASFLLAAMALAAVAWKARRG